MKLLTTEEVTKIIGKSSSTLRRWWKSGAFPAPLQYKGKTLGWSEELIKQWFSDNEGKSLTMKVDDE